MLLAPSTHGRSSTAHTRAGLTSAFRRQLVLNAVFLLPGALQLTPKRALAASEVEAASSGTQLIQVPPPQLTGETTATCQCRQIKTVMVVGTRFFVLALCANVLEAIIQAGEDTSP